MMRATAFVVFLLVLQSVSAELESEWGPGTYDNKSLGKIRRLLKTRGLQTKGTVGSSSAPKMSKSNSSNAPRMSKSTRSCYVNDFSSYDISFEEGEIQLDFDFDVNCETPEILQGCCRKVPCSVGNCPGGGKQCIRDGGVWIADDGSNGNSAASYNCCDPKLFEDLLNSESCVVDGSRGPCYSPGDDCSPVRYNSYGGGGGAASGFIAGIAGCDRAAVDEIVATADTC